MSLDHMALVLAVGLIGAGLKAASRALQTIIMLRTALRGSAPAEREAILNSLAKIRPFNPAAIPVPRRIGGVDSSFGNALHLEGQTEEADHAVTTR
jgi:hypothetical protein